MNTCKYRNLDGMCIRLSEQTKNEEDKFFCNLSQSCMYGFVKLAQHFNILTEEQQNEKKKRGGSK